VRGWIGSPRICCFDSLREDEQFPAIVFVKAGGDARGNMNYFGLICPVFVEKQMTGISYPRICPNDASVKWKNDTCCVNHTVVPLCARCCRQQGFTENDWTVNGGMETIVFAPMHFDLVRIATQSKCYAILSDNAVRCGHNGSDDGTSVG
jgi:hypothetical protein